MRWPPSLLFFLRLSQHSGIVRALFARDLVLSTNLYVIANATAQLLTVPPYAVSAVVLILVSYVSDKRQTRGYFVAGANVLAAVGYV